jgi:endonuclease/exonuclease/phosphatase family metal-dependent hydrolase
VIARALFVSLTLGLWLGIYAFRSFVPAAVWNLGDALPLALKPVLAVGTQLLGVSGLIVVIKWRRRALLPLAIAFAAATVARQLLLSSDQVGPWLALTSWALWLPFMAALADEVAAHDAEFMIAPALAAAVALQLGMQSAWHGLDLHVVSGPLTVAVTVLLCALLCLAVARTTPAALPRPHSAVAWWLLGPAFFLELTFVGNAGRLSEITGYSIMSASLLMIATLLIAVVIAQLVTSLAASIALVVVAFIAAFAIPGARGAAALIMLAVQIVLVCALREGADRRVRLSAATATTVGMVLFFVLIFAFYNAYELTALWALALAPLAVAAGLAQRQKSEFAKLIALPFGTAALLAFTHLMPPPAASAPTRNRDPLRIATYNIHHGFNHLGTPGMTEIARAIAAMNPDVLALQEIGRGWTLLGGSDMVAYLRWRFPDYQIFFAPTNGQLSGNAIMTRLRMPAVTSHVFAADPGVFRYGWIVGRVTDRGEDFHFYSVHLTADLEARGGDARTQQAAQLLQILGAGTPVLVGGDFNANPEDAPLQLLTKELADLGVAAGLGAHATWPATRPEVRIDYLLGRGFTVADGMVPRTNASDHLPVLLTVRPSHATPDTVPSSNRRSP